MGVNNVIEREKFYLWICANGQKTLLRANKKEDRTQGRSNQTGNGNLF